MKPAPLKRLAIVVGCLVSGAVWPVAMGNLLLIGVAGCEEPACGESPLLYTGLFVVAMAAMTLAMAGIATETTAKNGRSLAVLAAGSMAAAGVLLVIGLGVGILVALGANVVFARSIVQARVYSSGAATTLAVASVGHLIGFGLLLFPFAWLWLAISVALGPRSKARLGIWRLDRDASVGGLWLPAGETVTLNSDGTLLTMVPRTSGVVETPLRGLLLQRVGSESVRVQSKDGAVEILISAIDAKPELLLGLIAEVSEKHLAGQAID